MVANSFTRWHVRIFVALWLAFAALTLCVVLAGLDNATQRPLTVAAAVVGSVLGPMSGAISRDLQPCCLAFSLSLLPVCLSALAVGTAAQVVRLPAVGWLRVARLAVWVAALVVWFGGGIVSFTHALS